MKAASSHLAVDPTVVSHLEAQESLYFQSSRLRKEARWPGGKVTWQQ